MNKKVLCLTLALTVCLAAAFAIGGPPGLSARAEESGTLALPADRAAEESGWDTGGNDAFFNAEWHYAGA